MTELTTIVNHDSVSHPTLLIDEHRSLDDSLLEIGARRCAVSDKWVHLAFHRHERPVPTVCQRVEAKDHVQLAGELARRAASRPATASRASNFRRRGLGLWETPRA